MNISVNKDKQINLQNMCVRKLVLAWYLRETLGVEFLFLFLNNYSIYNIYEIFKYKHFLGIIIYNICEKLIPTK